MKLYDKILYLCKERNVSVASVEKACGMSHGVLRRWNVQHPTAERLRKVSEYFGVTVSYLLDETDERDVEYYIDPEVSAIAQELKDRPELKVLFDASRNVKKEDIELVAEMIRRMSGGKNV